MTEDALWPLPAVPEELVPANAGSGYLESLVPAAQGWVACAAGRGVADAAETDIEESLS